jgi:hypothetical protein
LKCEPSKILLIALFTIIDQVQFDFKPYKVTLKSVAELLWSQFPILHISKHKELGITDYMIQQKASKFGIQYPAPLQSVMSHLMFLAQHSLVDEMTTVLEYLNTNTNTSNEEEIRYSMSGSKCFLMEDGKMVSADQLFFSIL